MHKYLVRPGIKLPNTGAGHCNSLLLIPESNIINAMQQGVKDSTQQSSSVPSWDVGHMTLMHPVITGYCYALVSKSTPLPKPYI